MSFSERSIGTRSSFKKHGANTFSLLYVSIPFGPLIFHADVQLSDLIGLLYDEAIRQGAEICLGTAAIAMDVEQGMITTKAGDILEADVIVGTDGIAGLTRTISLREQEIAKSADRPSMWMYRWMHLRLQRSY